MQTHERTSKTGKLAYYCDVHSLHFILLKPTLPSSMSISFTMSIPYLSPSNNKKNPHSSENLSLTLKLPLHQKNKTSFRPNTTILSPHTNPHSPIYHQKPKTIPPLPKKSNSILKRQKKGSYKRINYLKMVDHHTWAFSLDSKERGYGRMEMVFFWLRHLGDLFLGSRDWGDILLCGFVMNG